MQPIFEIQANVQGLILIYYYRKLIALLNASGEFAWRDEQYPVYLIEYLMMNSTHQYMWN